ncbi:DUF1768-domain-containing protein [Zopfia rhizophila CBS 207.26]|uniref:DUF1768-domain-containing protein n=1 Tax=Zopfia rhizophila CBS 207.26 TaxID=1314779 RepID=A0A6A6EJN4_9PEZI|nr:DUF1768-domain-containing protein [Zopfia rhizophila CBS 207.26]
MPPKKANRVTKSKSTKNKKPLVSKSTHTSNSNSGSNMPVSTQVSTSASVSANANATSLDNEPVYFWRPFEENGYLGQWYESEWEHEGCKYVTAEMWMMVQKAKLFGDEECAQRMLATTDPKRHKALGREVRNFNDKTWNLHRTRIVEEGTYHKFTKSKNAIQLRQWLLETRDRELVETSPRDRIWGVGFGKANAGKNRHRWGQNLLGKALMSVRERLRGEQKEDK